MPFMASAQDTDRSPFRFFLALGLVFLAALLTRLYGIHRESLSFDAFTSVVHLHPQQSVKASPYYDRWRAATGAEACDSVWEYLRRNRFLDPASMPAYYSLAYFFNRHVSQSLLALRLFSVGMGMAVVFLLYQCGRELFGRRAGLIAAACAALSPVHWYYSREIRVYGFLALAAMVHLYTFQRLVRGGGKHWWTVHGIVTLLLVWTHPFAVLIPVAEALFLAGTHWRDRPLLRRWGILQAALALPALAYVFSISYWSPAATPWMVTPSLRHFLGDLLADDILGLSFQFRPDAATWARIVPEAAAHRVVGWHGRIGWVMLALTLGGVLWAIVSAARRRIAAKDAPTTWRWTVLLLLWWLLPPLLLYAASHLWRPCIWPRYTLYASFGLYLLLGAGLAQLPGRLVRGAAVTALLVLYACQQMLVLDAAQDRDWRAAARHILAHGTPDDFIVYQDWLFHRGFLYEMGPAPQVSTYAKTVEGLAELTAFVAGLKTRGPDDPRSVWALMEVGATPVGSDVLESRLLAAALSFSVREFGGLPPLRLYQVRRGQAAPRLSSRDALPEDIFKDCTDLAMAFWWAQDMPAAEAAARRALDFHNDYARAWLYLGLALAEQKKHGAHKALLRATAPPHHDFNAMEFALLSRGLLRTGDPEQASAMAASAVISDPNHPAGYYARAAIEHARGNEEEKQAALTMARRRDPHARRMNPAVILGPEFFVKDRKDENYINNINDNRR